MDPYKILKIDRNASPEQIRAAYLKAAKRHHPDQGGDAWAFQQVQQAYESLTGIRRDAKHTRNQKKASPQEKHSPPQEPTSKDTQGISTFQFRDSKVSKRLAQKKKKRKNSAVQLVGIIGGSVISVFLIFLFLFSLLPDEIGVATKKPPEKQRGADSEKPHIRGESVAKPDPDDDNPQPTPQPDNRAAIPSEFDIAKTREKVDNIFGALMADSSKPEHQREIIGEMMQTAVDNQWNSTEVFAVFQKAYDIGISLVGHELVWEAAEELGRRYQVDELLLKRNALEKFSKMDVLTSDFRSKLVSLTADLAEQAKKHGRNDLADELLEMSKEQASLAGEHSADEK